MLLNAILALVLEIAAGIVVFGIVLPLTYRRLRNPASPGSLPDSDEIPWWSNAVIYLGSFLTLYYPMSQMFRVVDALRPLVWLFLFFYYQSVITLLPELVRRLFGRAVLDTDPWFEPIERLRNAARVGSLRLRIIRSKQTRPTINLLNEIELPSFLLRIAASEEVAILCAPAILQRKFRWRRPRWWIASPNILVHDQEIRAAADRLVAQVFADPEVLHRALMRQGSSAAEAEARVATLWQGRNP